MRRRFYGEPDVISPTPAQPDASGPSSHESEAPEELTGIPLRIPLAATNGGGEGRSEQDQIAIEHFLDALARIALAIASRPPIRKDRVA